MTQEEAVRPTDICIVCNGARVAEDLQTKLAPELAKIGIELSLQKNRSFERNNNTLVITTSDSYKGYESEVIIVPCVDQFVTGQGDVLANNLYVAMTRARSLLAIYGTRDSSAAAQKIFASLERCVEQLDSVPKIDSAISRQIQFNDLLEQVGAEHRSWLGQLWDHYELQLEPLVDASENVIAQPLFWFKEPSGEVVACNTSRAIEEHSGAGIRWITIGEPFVKGGQGPS